MYNFNIAWGGGEGVMGWVWGVWVGGDCFNDDCTYETLWAVCPKLV